MTQLIWLFIAYLVGTYTGYAMFRRSIMGKVCIAICDIFDEKHSKKS